jgi:hypothetical protein
MRRAAEHKQTEAGPMAGKRGDERTQVPEIPPARRRELGEGAMVMLVLVGEVGRATTPERSGLAH